MPSVGSEQDEASNPANLQGFGGHLGVFRRDGKLLGRQRCVFGERPARSKQTKLVSYQASPATSLCSFFESVGRPNGISFGPKVVLILERYYAQVLGMLKRAKPTLEGGVPGF